MIKVVVFDCDGVMFDSREANRAFYNHILADFGRKEMTEEELFYVHMHTADDSIAYLFRSRKELESAQQHRLDTDYTLFLPLMIMEPGLKEFLRYLKPKYKVAIATNRTTTMNKLLDIFELKSYFDMVVSALDVANSKPHPESLLKIMDELKVLPQEVIYIGDSELDEKAAYAAGVRLTAYKNKGLTAAYHVDSFHEVIPILEDNCSS